MNGESYPGVVETQVSVGPAVSPLLVLISAPSGGGKTTLCQQLLAARPEMTRAVTCTTRPPRASERDGWITISWTPVPFAGRCKRAISSSTPLFTPTAMAPSKPRCSASCGRAKRVAERGCAGRGDHPRKGAGRPELKRALISFPDPSLAGNPRRTPAQTRHRLRASHSETAERRPAGDRPVEKL